MKKLTTVTANTSKATRKAVKDIEAVKPVATAKKAVAIEVAKEAKQAIKEADTVNTLKPELLAFVRSAETMTAAAIDAMTAYGYDANKDWKFNALVFKSVKGALKNILEIDYEPFSIKDGSTADRKYNSFVTVLSRSCYEGLNNGKESKAPSGKVGAKGGKGTTIKERPATVELMELTADDTNYLLNQEITFRGTIADFMEDYGTDVMKYIASDATVLSQLLAMVGKVAIKGELHEVD